MNNKIILATSGLSGTENLFNCIKDIIGNTQSMIVEANISEESLLTNAFPDTRSMQEARDRVYSNATRFEDTCIKFRIRHATRPQFDNYFLEDLVEDSRFADLIVCSSQLFANSNKSYETIVRRLECPLLLMPEKSENLMMVDLFIFDGSMYSIQALKRFTYLFPERSSSELLLVDYSIQNDESKHLTRWLSAHYHGFRWVREFPVHNQYNLICGSLERSILPAHYKVPVFICHS